MSWGQLLSDGAQKMGDLLVDIIEGIGQKITGMGAAISQAVSSRGEPGRSESTSSPMVDGERVRAPETPGMNRVRSQGGPSQSMALGHDDDEDPQVQAPKVKVLGIKNPNDLAFVKDLGKNDQVLFAMAHYDGGNVAPAMTAGKVREVGGMGMTA